MGRVQTPRGSLTSVLYTKRRTGYISAVPSASMILRWSGEMTTGPLRRKSEAGWYFNVLPTACLRDLSRKNQKRAVKTFPPSLQPWPVPDAEPMQQKHEAGRGPTCESQMEFSWRGEQKNLGLISRATELDMRWSYDLGPSNTDIYGLRAQKTEKFSPNPPFLILKRRLNDSATKR